MDQVSELRLSRREEISSNIFLFFNYGKKSGFYSGILLDFEENIGYYDYIFLTDINTSPCITAKKESKLNRYKNIEEKKIIIVIKEIESWYLAGIDEKDSKVLGIPLLGDTNNLNKEQFNRLIPKKFASSRNNFMQEVLNYYQIIIAKRKNKSYKYFLNKIYE